MHKIKIDNSTGFQSTLPSQGATNGRKRLHAGTAYFNPRSPHRERHRKLKRKSLHKIFQSTLPSQGATVSWQRAPARRNISIHAPLTGSDLQFIFERGLLPLFQSTLPSQGATLLYLSSLGLCQYFNPRPPHRERRRLCR